MRRMSAREHTVDGALGFWEIARAHPKRVAVVGPDGAETTYGALYERVNRLSRGLRAFGLRPGDVVAVLQPNGTDFLAVQLATAQLGLYLTAINWHLTADEIAYILTDSDARLFLASARFADAARAAATAAGLPPDRCFGVPEVAGFRPLTELVAGQPADPPADRLAGRPMLYTSGTTGRPKGVRPRLPGCESEADLARRLPTVVAQYGLTPGDGVHLVVSPLYHSAPARHAGWALHLGHLVVVMDRFTPEGALELIQRYRVTDSFMVPIMFQRLLALPEETRKAYDTGSLRQVFHAGAPCPVETKRRMLEWWGPVLYEFYSSTEGGGTFVRPEEWLARPGTVGRAWLGAQVRILDDDGRELPPGKPGTVYLRNGDGFEYHKDPAKTAAAYRGDFFTVGDVGYLDEDGYLYLLDRRTDLIISGGVNIYPAEVEGVLQQHPAVGDVVVVGLPDPEWGQRVTAVVEPAAGVALGAELAAELTAFCRERLAGYKCPREVRFAERLPRTPTGKLSRAHIRAEYASG